MAFVKIAAGNRGIRAADSVFILQKGNVVFRRISFEKLLIDAVFPLVNTAAAGKNGVDILLRNNKSGGFLVLRFCDYFLLLFSCG